MLREFMIERLWSGADPFKCLRGEVDIQGWEGSSHPWLVETIREIKPQIIVEVGVWKGASALHMADELRRLKSKAVIVAVDTFQGSAEHWVGEYRIPIVGGRPSLYETFIRNVMAAGLQKWIVPLPIDSVNAAMVFADLGVSVDMVHLDAAHDAMSVSMDLQAWWSVLASGGVLIGDDYVPEWPGVVAAFDAFTARMGVVRECSAPKIRLRKL